MSIHTVVFAALGLVVAGLWWYAEHVARISDQALLARANQLPDGGHDGRCPQCGGWHCEAWRQLGAPCPPQRLPQLPVALGMSGGRHTPVAAWRRNNPRWNPLSLRERVELAPAAWAARLGRPVQLGLKRTVLP